MKFNSIILLLSPVIFLAGLFLASCAKSAPENGPTAGEFRSSVSGKVVDKNGDGLGGVAITTQPAGHTTVSLSDGSFELPDIEAEADNNQYRLHFHLVDYLDTISEKFEIGLAQVIKLKNNVRMTFRYATVKGTVTDKAGNPLIGAGIIVEEQGIYGMSGSGGSFTLKRVEPGSIKLLSAFPGKGAGLKSVTISHDEVKTGVGIIQDREGGAVSGQLLKGDQGIIQQKRGAAPVPLVNASVSAMGGAVFTTTDTLGYFLLKGIPSGGIVILSVVDPSSGDTMQVGGIEVAEKAMMDMQSITMFEGVTQNRITLTPFSTMAESDQSRITLLVGTSVTGGAVIDVYNWDTDNDGAFDTVTATPRLEVVTGAAGVRYVRVQAVDTEGGQSGIAYLQIDVVAPMTATAADTTGIIGGAAAYTGALGPVSASVPIVVEAFPANDFLMASSSASDTVTSFPGTYSLSLPAGNYKLRLFLDMNGDGKLSASEPSAAPASGFRVARDTVITFHFQFGDEKAVSSDKVINPGMYTAEYIWLLGSDSGRVLDTLILNSDNSFHYIEHFDFGDPSMCQGALMQGLWDATDSTRIGRNQFVRSGNFCTGEWDGPWREYNQSDTMFVTDVWPDSFRVRVAGMQNLSGGMKVTFRKISGTTDETDWVFTGNQGFIIVEAEYTGSLGAVGYDNFLSITVDGSGVPGGGPVDYRFGENPTVAYFQLPAGTDYRFAAMFDADGDRERSVGDPVKAYNTPDTGCIDLDSAAQNSIRNGEQVRIKITFGDECLVQGNYGDDFFNGAWLLLQRNIPQELDKNSYILFDGAGTISEFGSSKEDRPAGTYSVNSNGSLTSVLTADSVGISGNIISADSVSLLLHGGGETFGPMALIRVNQENAAEGGWAGSFTRDGGGTTQLGFTIGSAGTIQGFEKLTGPVEGRFYIEGNQFAGYFTSSTPEFPAMSLSGSISGDTITGQFQEESSGSGTFVMTVAGASPQMTTLFSDSFNRGTIALDNGWTGMAYLAQSRTMASDRGSIVSDKLKMGPELEAIYWAVINPAADSISSGIVEASAVFSSPVLSLGEVAFSLAVRRTLLDSVGSSQLAYFAGLSAGPQDTISLQKYTASGTETLAWDFFNCGDADEIRITISADGGNITMDIENLTAGDAKTLQAVDPNPLSGGMASIHGWQSAGRVTLIDDFVVKTGN